MACHLRVQCIQSALHLGWEVCKALFKPGIKAAAQQFREQSCCNRSCWRARHPFELLLEELPTCPANPLAMNGTHLPSLFPHIVVWGSCFFAAPPRSSSSLLPPSSSLTTTSLTQHLSQQHQSLTTTSLTTTSLRQHPTHNVSHTTSLTQHLSQQHLTHNSTHTTSHTQRLAYNITHTTSLTTTSHTQQHTHNIPHTTSRTQHHSHNISHNNISHTTSLTQHPTHSITHTTSPTRPLLAKGSDAKGSGVRPGVVWRRLGTGADFAAGAALCCLPKGRVYALASSGVGWAPAQISWQAQHFAACLKGSDVRPGVVWRRLASAGHRRRFRGRRSTLLLAKGSDVRPGVVWRRLGTGADFVAGAALCCLPRGRMYALASSGGVWRRLGTGADFVAGAALCCLPRGRMYALASSGVVWRRLGHRRRFRGRRSTLLLAKGSDVRPGVVWRRLASAGHRRWQAQHFAACQGVGCTPWRRLASSGVGWAPAQISWQAQRFVNLHVQISWQAQHLWSWKLRTGDFVVQLQYAEYLRGWKMRTGDFVVQL